MSAISPEELINDVKPWDIDSWRKFLEEYVAPVEALASTVAKQFVGDPAAEIAGEVAKRASRVLTVAKNVIGEVNMEFKVPEDPIECLRMLVEKSGNMFLGVGEGGKHTLFAWTLRKVTKEYLFKALYPTLEDEEKRRKTFEILGIREDKPIFIPAVKSPLTEDLTILGYPDYPSISRVEEWGGRVTLSILPAQKPTFGGSLCRLVDGLVALLNRPGILSGVEPSADVVKSYLNKCPAPPTEIHTYSWFKLPWRESYINFNELCKLSHDYAWVIQGFAIRCVDVLKSPEEWERIVQETNLLSFLRWLMPSLITGRTELLLSADGRVALTIERIV